MVIDFSHLTVNKLDDTIDVSQFKCRSQEIQDYLTEYSMIFQNESLGITYIVHHNSKMVGFFTISMDSLRIKKLNTIDQIGYDNIEHYPSIKIGQLCVDIDLKYLQINQLLIQSYP